MSQTDIVNTKKPPADSHASTNPNQVPERSGTLWMSLYFPLVTCWYEFVLKLMSFGLLQVRWTQWVATFALSLCYGFFIYYIFALLRSQTARHIFLYGLHAFYLIIYAGQAIYYQTFQAFLPFASIDQGGTAVADHFLGQAIVAFVRGIPTILLLLLPTLVFRLKHMKNLLRWRVSVSGRRYSLLTSGLILILVTLFIQLQNSNVLPPSLLYYHRYVPKLSVQEFGLITTMRIDFMQNIYSLVDEPESEVVRIKGVEDLLERELSYERAPEEEMAGFSILENKPFDPSPVTNPVETEGVELAVLNFRKQTQEEYYREKSTLLNARKPRSLTATEEIDLQSMEQTAEDPALAPMHFYFDSQYDRVEHRYTGLFKGKNLIWIMAESHSPWAIDSEMTPTLYKMQQEGLQVPNYYNPLWGVSTTDGEYTHLLSQYPVPGRWSMIETRYHHLNSSPGWAFRDAGYHNYAWHNHEWTYYQRPITHTHLGFDYDGVGGGLELTNYYPTSDAEMMDVTYPLSTDEEPFFIYYLTMSGHMMYETKYNDMALRHSDDVPEREEWTEEARAYVAANIEVEDGVRLLIEDLEADGKLEDTVILITNDHYPYGLREDSMHSLVRQSEDPFEIYRGTFILWTPDMADLDLPVVDKYAAAVDVAPTIMNLFGLPYDAKLLVGHDMLGPEPGEVLYQDYSWQSIYGTYDAFIDDFKPSQIVSRAAYQWAFDHIDAQEVGDERTLRRLLQSEEFEQLMDSFKQQVIRQENARIDLRFVMSHAMLDSDYERILLEGETETEAYHTAKLEEEALAAEETMNDDEP